MDLLGHAGALVTLALVLGAFLFARRYGGGKALEELERANRILTSRVTELEASDARKTAELVQLRASRDVSLAILPVLEALKTHETEAGKRVEAMLDVLGLIASRLGPDAEAGT